MENLRLLLVRLTSSGYLPLSSRRREAARQAWVNDGHTDRRVRVRRRGRSRLRLSEVSWLIGQLATTQGAGIPLYRALGMIAKMREGSPIGRKAKALQDATSEGATLSQAIALNMPEAGSLISALVASGESSGALESALRRAVQLTEATLRLRRKLRTALTYPAMVLVVCAALVTAMLTVVVPRFESIYASVGAELPSMTKLVLSAADRFPILVGVFAAAVAGMVMLVRRGRRDPRIGDTVDRIRLGVPVLGRLVRKAAIARATQTLASLISSGVSLLDALDLAARTSGSKRYERALTRTKERIGEGSTLAAALAETGEFPELMVQLVAVGEESGSLSSVLEHYAAEASEELESAAESVTSLVEPMLMVFIGGVIAVFVVALYLPIITLGQKLGG